MPYIKSEYRHSIDDRVNALAVWLCEECNIGEVNYAITTLLHKYMMRNNTVTYERFNEIIGVLESVKLEFYRRGVVPYENLKIQENGDVDTSLMEVANYLDGKETDI